MAKQCDDCKFYDTDYEWDEDMEDEYPIFACLKKRNELHDDNADCPCFKKYSQRHTPPTWKREFVCGMPDENGNCEMIETTTL